MDIQDKKLINEKNQIIQGKIIVTFYSENTKKNYVIYTTEKQNDNLILYSASFDEENDSLKLHKITDEKEWDVIEKVVDALKETGEVDNISIFSDID